MRKRGNLNFKFILLNIITCFVRVSKSYLIPIRNWTINKNLFSHNFISTVSVIPMMRRNHSNLLECKVSRRTDLADFLNQNTNRIKSWSNSQDQGEERQMSFKIIMGNEAGDADSIISAITLAHVESLRKHDESKMEVLLPIASIARQDIGLRNDINLLFDIVGIDQEQDLIYLDDDIFQKIVHDDNIHKSVVLVDHNKLRSDLWHLEGYVEEIIDHHQDEGAHSDSVHDDLREIAFEDNGATAGSTCTLIVERLMVYMHDNDNHTSGTERVVDPGLGLALLGVILLDTMNMSEHAGKGTLRDQKAIDFLMDHVAWDSLNLKEPMRSKIFSFASSKGALIPNREHLFIMLQDSKFDPDFWARMSARDALRIDYKRFEASQSNKNVFGLSSVLLSMEDLISKPNFSQAAISFMQEVDVNLLGVLTMVIQNDKPVRELVLIGDSQIVQNMASYLLHNENASILDIKEGSNTLSPLEIIDSGHVMMKLKQGNPKGSRKQVAPIMLSYF